MKKLAVIFLCAAALALAVVADIDDQWLANMYRARAAFRQRGYDLPESRASLQHQPDRSQFHAQAAEKPYDSLEEDILAAVEEVLNKKLYPNQEMASEYHQDKDVDTALMAEMEAPFDYSQPVLPRVYQRELKQGLNTNFFKRSRTAEKYREGNIQKVYRKGFRNVRLRVRPELYEKNDYVDPYDAPEFNTTLTKLKEVVEDCIKYRVAPIISWVNHQAEARADDRDRNNYLEWWKRVATKLKDINYHLSFNLFTELGTDYCRVPANNLDCDKSLRRNISKYNNWTKSVVDIIRNSGGNNKERILILSSPAKTAAGLDDIDPSIYRNDSYMMVEWHSYAAGPKQHTQRNNKTDPRNWYGDGTIIGRGNVNVTFEDADKFTDKTGLLSYCAEWMPQDNQYAALNQEEVISFARYFAQKLKEKKIPWSLNVLDVYMDTKNNRWLTEIQDVPSPRIKFTGTPARLNMSLVLDNIIEVM